MENKINLILHINLIQSNLDYYTYTKLSIGIKIFDI